jgi:hypothetical protein
MAKNTGLGYRQGQVAGRTQLLNPKTKQYVKRDAITGQFMGSQSTPYKGVRREKK